MGDDKMSQIQNVNFWEKNQKLKKQKQFHMSRLYSTILLWK